MYCKINLLFQFYTDISFGEKRINILVQIILIYLLCFYPLITCYFKMLISTCLGYEFYHGLNFIYKDPEIIITTALKWRFHKPRYCGICCFKTRKEHDAMFLVLLREVAVQQERRWIERRRLLGQCETLFKELERESRGDYVGYIRVIIKKKDFSKKC